MGFNRGGNSQKRGRGNFNRGGNRGGRGGGAGSSPKPFGQSDFSKQNFKNKNSPKQITGEKSGQFQMKSNNPEAKSFQKFGSNQQKFKKNGSKQNTFKKVDSNKSFQKAGSNKPQKKDSSKIISKKQHSRNAKKDDDGDESSENEFESDNESDDSMNEEELKKLLGSGNYNLDSSDDGESDSDDDQNGPSEIKKAKKIEDENESDNAESDEESSDDPEVVAKPVIKQSKNLKGKETIVNKNNSKSIVTTKACGDLQKMVTEKNSKNDLNKEKDVSPIKGISKLPSVKEDDSLKHSLFTPGKHEEILAEQRKRIDDINSRSLYIRPLSKNCTPSMIKELVKEMISCRIPISKNVSCRFGFVEFKTSALADKYIGILSGKLFGGKPIVAQRDTSGQKCIDSINKLDLKSLHVLCLSRETKLSDLKILFPTAEKIEFPTTKDMDSAGYANVVYSNTEDAVKAFNQCNGKIVRGKSIYVIFNNIRVNDKSKKPVKTSNDSRNSLKMDTTPSKLKSANALPKTEDIKSKKRSRNVSDSSLSNSEITAASLKQSKKQKLEKEESPEEDSDENDSDEGSFDDEKLAALMGSDDEDESDDDDDDD